MADIDKKTAAPGAEQQTEQEAAPQASLPATGAGWRGTLVSFPGGVQHLDFPSGQVTLRMALTRAGVLPQDFGNGELAVNNAVTNDYGLVLPDGAVITRTVRVEGGASES